MIILDRTNDSNRAQNLEMQLHRVRRRMKLRCQEQTHIAFPPGSRLLHLAELLIDRKNYEQVFLAIVADWHAEYFEALDNQRGYLKLLFIRARYTWGLLKAVGLIVSFSSFASLRKSLSL